MPTLITYSILLHLPNICGSAPLTTEVQRGVKIFFELSAPILQNLNYVKVLTRSQNKRYVFYPKTGDACF